MYRKAGRPDRYDGHDNNRRVAHLRLLQQFADKQHMEMLLPEPCVCQTTPAFYCLAEYYCAVPVAYRSKQRSRLHGLTHRVELVITSYFLNCLSSLFSNRTK